MPRYAITQASFAPGTLILICGLPGSGKTTFAKRLETKQNAIRMNPDDWIEAVLASPGDITERDRLRDPVENLQWDLAKSYLRKGLTVILENGFWAQEERTQYAWEALEAGARIELFYLEATDFEKLWGRVQGRNVNLVGSPFVMTKEEVLAGWNHFQAPTPEELAFYDGGGIVTWDEQSIS